ncbi:MAG: sulfite exporter TauE/SafE family protein [Acidobacteriota bacterium]
MSTEIILLGFLIFAAAMLYSSVGHGGASGYLAVMALFSFPPATMRPTALILNICVSSIAALTFARQGFFSWRKFYPFALGSIPFAFLGGSMSLPPPFFKIVIGIVLLVAAFLLARGQKASGESVGQTEEKTIPLPLALACGAGLGLLSGLTGVGGGIFLSPILLFSKWTDIRQTAAISAMFILVNSVAGLAANLTQTTLAGLPSTSLLVTLAVLVVIGGLLGANFGANRKQSTLVLRRLLALVLVIAAWKMILG